MGRGPNKNRTRAVRNKIRRAKKAGLYRLILAMKQAKSGDVRGLLEDSGSRATRSDLALLRKYMGCAQFTEDELSAMIRRMGGLVAASDSDMVKVIAFKALLEQGKFSFNMIHNTDKQEFHRHVHIEQIRARQTDNEESDAESVEMPIAYIEEPSLDDQAATLKEAEELGLLKGMIEGGGNGKPKPSK
jgi:hypothetical protein